MGLRPRMGRSVRIGGSRMVRLTIGGRFVGLNDYIQAERANRYKAAKIKRENTDRAASACKAQRIPRQNEAVELEICWYEPNRRRDLDNIGFAVKFIQDGMVKAGVLPDDSQKWVRKIVHTAKVDNKNPRVEITIRKFETEED